MHKYLIITLEGIISLQKEEKKSLTTLFKEIKIKKGDFFLMEGNINYLMGFINKGLVRYFVFKNGEESTLEFSKEGEFIGEYESFRSGTPAIQNIQAIEDSVILVIENEGLQYIYDHFIDGNKFGRIAIEARFNHLIKQLLSIYMHNPEQRYVNFIRGYPDLVKRVPQYYVASYVGVKPESLSRIRKRISN